MLTQDTAWIRARRRLEREVVTVASIAARLEHRLHWPDVDSEDLARGCDYAVGAGLAAVLCRPEHIAAAARQVAGTTTAAVTALAFHDPSRPQAPAELAAEAVDLVSAGASEVALIVAPGLESDGYLHLVSERVQAVVESVTPQGGKLRVLLNTTDMTHEEVGSCTAAVGAAGAWLVQGGSFHGDRATFRQVETMRESLPGDVLLKWTQAVRSVEMMLVCMGLGVDRFNGDIPALLQAARRSSDLAPLMVPLYGTDF